MPETLLGDVLSFKTWMGQIYINQQGGENQEQSPYELNLCQMSSLAVSRVLRFKTYIPFYRRRYSDSLVEIN